MNNYKIVIDAGHGGSDPGSSGNGIIEKDLTLKISQYMYDLFKEKGIPVTMTRTTDETLSPDERVSRILSAYGDNKNVIVVSNHINAGGADGAEVIYALRNNSTLSNLILNSLKNAGQNVREAYQRRLPSNTAKDYYFIHRNTGNTEAIIVEYGFLDSTLDDPTQLKNYYKNLTKAVVDAILEYIGYSVEQENVYTVKSGDSLWSIAKKFNTTVDDLKKANNLTSNSLSIGQKLVIPGKKESTSNNVYTVQKGDSLYSIARKYNVDVNALKQANNLSSNLLSIGQVLIIPTGTEDYILYKVVSGDSLYSIAKKYGITMQEIMDFNNLGSTILTVGQVLKIPVAYEEEIPSTSEVTYTVKSGDNLYSIARKYNVTVSDLMNYNNLTSNLLSIGQVIRIPSNTSSSTTYTVKNGDTLYSIARKYNTSVDSIKTKNNLTSNTLSIGQRLII
ncbi:MAG: LysM peptidoglycan-binding domain-containing protein [Tenericutes bacterium]|nr:LysM peptidoglycan-binding domain-containing protein [Mycoplasmatota bacterium]